MIRPLRLLFLAPFSQAAHCPGLEYAGGLARALGRPLHIAAFTDPHGVESAGPAGAECPNVVRQSALAQRQKWLKDESARLQEKGVEVHPEVVRASSSAAEFAAYAHRIEADLVIKDMQAGPGLAHCGLLPQDWEFLSVSPVSVLYVQPGPMQIRGKFLAAIDMEFQAKEGDSDNHAIIEAARHLASTCGAALHVISVYDSDAPGQGDLSRYDARKQDFEDFALQHGIAREHRHFIPGAPANAICAYLQRSAYNLLVIGVANHHLMPSGIGLTAEGILENAGCSVLAIKAPGFGEQRKEMLRDIAV
jgi:universal stress protein E